jgi:hypothetical protein
MHLGNDRNESPRYGVCHRCGWKGPVTKIHVTTRIVQPSVRGYGRLCADCRILLLHEHVPFLPSHKAGHLAELETKRYRHVA